MSDSAHEPAGVSAESRAAGHEVADADAGLLVKAGIGMAALMLIALVGMALMFRTLTFVQPLISDTPPPHPLSDTRAVYEGPRLQPDPPRQKQELREYEDHLLTTYDWVDKDNGVARIPVNRAIELLAKTGLPEPAANTDAPAPAPSD